MTEHNRKFRRAWLGLCMPLLLALAPAANGTAITLSNTPLFVLSNAKNNIMLVIDDSGSMDFETLFHSNDGNLWWDDSTTSFVNSSGSTVGSGYDTTASGSVYWNGDSPKFYLFPDGSGTGNRVFTSNSGYSTGTIPPFIQYAFARSSDYNKAYYDPTQTYSAWPSMGTTAYVDKFSDASPTAALSDPTVPASSGGSTMNLTVDEQTSTQWWDFYMEPGMVMPAGTTWACEGSSNWQTTSSDTTLASGGSCSSAYSTDTPKAGMRLGIKYYPATYFTKVTTGSYTVEDSSSTTHSGTCNPTTSTEITAAIANYGYFEKNPSTLTAISGTVDALGPDGGCLEKHVIAAGTTEMQNFANWFQYYRKRHLALRAGIGSAFENLTGTRVGYFTINHLPSSTSPITMYDMDTASDKQTLFDDLYGITGNLGGTDLRKALDRAGKQYMISSSGAPITDDCQKCFAILFTDGFNSDTSFSGIGNEDGSSGTPYADSYSNTLADIAMYYYTTNLRSDLTSGQVPTDSGCSTATSPTSLDCNPDLHMNTYTVGLDLEGTLFGQTFTDSGGGTYSYNSVSDAYDSSHYPAWPDVTATYDPRQVDDLYHAAVNGRGEMYNATDTTDIGTQLGDALANIATHSGSAAAVSFNTSTLTSNSYVYESIFNPTDWTGDLQAYSLNASNGDINGLAASAQADLQTASSRVILTYNGTTDTGVPFNISNWSNLSTAERDDLKTDTDGTLDPSDDIGKARLGYIRGDQSCEAGTHTSPSALSLTSCSYGTTPYKTQAFRYRNYILGDIVHSSPVYVGAPNIGWPDTAPFPDGTGGTVAYSTFQTNEASRTPMLYVGANDGMLHGFKLSTDASNNLHLDEALAYIPSNLFSTSTDEGLHYLTDPTYSHHYYVDLTPSVSDIYDWGTNAWKTVLVGGERGGGRGIYALNVTDPSSFAETTSAAASTVMWEFTSADDPNLGYTYSRPTIALLNNGRWAAVFGNGYDADTSGTVNGITADGKARLFIVFLDADPSDGWQGVDIDGSTVTGTYSSTTDYISIVADTGSDSSPNGLSTPALVDTNGDGVPDRVYAGDLDGHMWAFDISDTSSPTNWKVAYKSGSTPKPLFTTQSNQPITVQPAVIDNPAVTSSNSNSPNLLILFGTGQYMTTGDITSTDTQSTYGVWDNGTSNLDYTNLQQQTVDSNYTSRSDLRVLTDTAVNYAGSGPSAQYGWYFNLPATGERLITTPLVRDGIFYYNTTIPSTTACSYGGSSWLMAVDATNGGSSSTPVFDITTDTKSSSYGAVDSGDLLTSNDGTSTAAAAGQELTGSGIAAGAAALGDYQYTATTDHSSGSGGDSGIQKRSLSTIDSLNTGRLSWKELGR